jgi:nicotinamidase-related amidase
VQIELNYPDPVPLELDPAKTLLLIVDMENEDAHPLGKRFAGDAVTRIIPSIATLRRKVRQAGGSVVHTQSVRKPDALEFTAFNNVIRKIEGTWGAEFVDELKPEADEPVVVKYTHDCFYRTEMESLLERLELRPADARIIVTGISSRSCVQCAVTGFSIRSYYVYVPIDCTGQRKRRRSCKRFLFLPALPIVIT